MSSSGGRAFDWNIFRRLYGQSKPYKRSFTITAILVLVIALISPVRPEQMREIIDVQVPAKNYSGVLLYALWFIAFIILEAILQYYQALLANTVAQSITLDLRSQLYRHILKFKLAYYDRTPVGQFVTRLISDIDGIAEVFSVGLLDIGRDILKLIVIIGFMLWLDWKMALIVMLPIPLLLYATRIFQQAVKKSFNDVRNEVSRINVFIQEHVTGMNIVQIFNREKKEKEKFVQINKEHRNAHIRGIWAYSVFFPVVELLSAMSISLMIWWGLHDVMSSSITPGLLLEFSTFVTMMYRPIRQMADNFNVLQMGVVNAERVFKVFDTDEKVIEAGVVDEKIYGHIEFKKVWFAYKEEQWVLRDIDLEIPQGKMTAVVGATGAGKSSLAGLINRFYEVNAGEILIDGVVHTHFSLDALRRAISLVLQDVYLFNDSIFNNIRLYNEAISDDEIILASKEIGTHDFIMQLPGNYSFKVGERGALLSVGQRQLISFVRAYVHKPSVLILDEATSSVDTASELLIQKATEKITSGRTSLVIAHRLSTIRAAHQIVVMEEGRIIEKGNHKELMQKNGHYKKLFDLQFSDLSILE